MDLKGGYAIAILLNGAIRNDSRVIKITRSLSKTFKVFLYYINPQKCDNDLFNDQVELRGFHINDVDHHPISRHLLIHRQYRFFIEKVLQEKIPFQYVYCNDYPTLSPGVKIAKKLNAELIYDSHEIYLETVNQFYPDIKGWKGWKYKWVIYAIRRIGRSIENKLLKKARLFITTNESYAGYFGNKYGHTPEVILMNCPETRKIAKQNLIRTQFGWDDHDMIILYQGVFNKGRGLEELIQSTQYMPKHFKTVLLGFGLLEKELKQLSSKFQVDDRVFFMDKVEHSELLDYSASASIGVLILDKFNKSKELSSANKIFEYMAAGIPIIATDLPENHRIIVECECGVLINTKNPKEIAKEIGLILEDVEKMETMGINGQNAYLDRYNWEKQEEKLLNALKIPEKQ